MKFNFPIRAFTYIEILISLFILSFMLLAVIATALNSLRSTEQNYLQSVASEQVISMAERLRANRSDSARTTACQQWNEENQRLLPKAKGECDCQQYSCKIKLNWQDQQLALIVNLN